MAPLPSFLPNTEWPEHDKLATMPSFFRPHLISAKPQVREENGLTVTGIYYRLWPFSFEVYDGDMEPEVAPLPSSDRTPFRIVIWQRYFRTDRPSAWRQFSEKPYLKIGYVELADDYEKGWSSSLRYARRKWLSRYLNQIYSVEEVSFEEFQAAYRRSDLPRSIRYGLFRDLAVRMKNPQVRAALYAARERKTGRIAGGLCALTSPSLKSVYYHAGFVMKENKGDPIMAGLFEHLFLQALKEGIRFVDFGIYWSKGDPSSWKGYSNFKMKFNPTYFSYPARLFKFRFLGR